MLPSVRCVERIFNVEREQQAVLFRSAFRRYPGDRLDRV